MLMQMPESDKWRSWPVNALKRPMSATRHGYLSNIMCFKVVDIVKQATRVEQSVKSALL
jgi:hypothetical protein